MCLIGNCLVSERCVMYVSYAAVATFCAQEVALSYSVSHLWATIFYVYVILALLPLRLPDALLAGLLLSSIHVPRLYIMMFYDDTREVGQTRKTHYGQITNFDKSFNYLQYLSSMMLVTISIVF